MRTLKSLPTIANVAAGNTVSITLPVGNTYEQVFVYFTGCTAAELQNIKTKMNDRLISEYPNGERLNSMDLHYDRNAKSGVLVFNFARPELHQLGDKRFFGLDTSKSQGVMTATIEIDIDDGASDPKLTAEAFVSQSVQGAPNYLTKVRRFIVPVSAVGSFDVDNIPRPAGTSIAAIHLYMPDDEDGDTDCQITKAELLVDNVNWHDISATRAADIQELNGRAPQRSDSAVIDLIQDGDIRHALVLSPQIQDMRLRCQAASTGQVEIMVEYIGQWSQGSF